MSSKSVGTIFPATFAPFMSLCHILVILTIFQIFSLLLVMVTCDHWSLMLLLKRSWFIESLDDSWHFLAIIFKLEYVLCVFRQCYCTLNRLQYSGDIIFIFPGKPEHSYVSLYCDIHFVAVVWNWTYSVFEACL